jgi:hypothetical protein
MNAMTNAQSKLEGAVGDIALLGAADAASWPSELARQSAWGVGPEQVQEPE